MAVTPDWQPILDYARRERARIWDVLCKDSSQVKSLSKSKADEIGRLFIDLRIDFLRAEAAVTAGGDLTGIPVDPRPEDAKVHEQTILVDYVKHYCAVMEEVQRRTGLDEIDFKKPAHERFYQDAEIELFENGTSVNPLY